MLEGRICDVDPQQVLMPGRLHCFFNRGSGTQPVSAELGQRPAYMHARDQE